MIAVTPPPGPPPPRSAEEQFVAALDRFIRHSVDPTERALVAALAEFIVGTSCPKYVRDAASAWLKGKTPTQPET